MPQAVTPRAAGHLVAGRDLERRQRRRGRPRCGAVNERLLVAVEQAAEAQRDNGENQQRDSGERRGSLLFAGLWVHVHHEPGMLVQYGVERGVTAALTSRVQRQQHPALWRLAGCRERKE
jgi:hypothetical protein